MEKSNKEIDSSNLSDSEMDVLAKRIGEKVGDSFNRMCDECRQWLKVYGMDIKVTYFLHPIGEDPLEKIREEQAKLSEPKVRIGKRNSGQVGKISSNNKKTKRKSSTKRGKVAKSEKISKKAMKNEK